MTPERYGKIKEIFQQAIELPLAQRDGYLESACASDSDLHREIESLLAAHEGAQGTQIVDKPAVALVPDMEPEESPDEVGRRIGPYRLVRLLGEGGMGAVYEASRDDDQFQQRVALKLVKGSAYSATALNRFRRERQILAALSHPNIARLLDGGVTPEGQPYFVMEFVDGKPINDYCEEKRLGVRERCRLFRDVCAAVQYAHQNLVIHRDLKPGNILVTQDGQVKLLDFGIAKLLEEEESEAATLTMSGMLVMTPEYASPEQVRGVKVTTATDVYSLGVVLYELLAGKRPFQFKDRLISEMARIICEEEPARPSTSAGDLDNIVLFALHKEPHRRYSSAEALSEDIRRYLDGEPVTAHPPSFAYRSTKFIRRYRTGVAAACLLVLSLTGGIIATWRQKVRADEEAAKAKAVNDFLQNDLLAQASARLQAGPNTKPDPELKVRTALDRAAARITGKFDRQPVVEASIRDTIGATYRDLGLYTAGQAQVRRALELRRQALGPEHPETLHDMGQIGAFYYFKGKYPEAENVCRRVLENQQRVLGPEHADTLSTMSDLVAVYEKEGKYSLAEPLSAKVVEIDKRVRGPEDGNTLTAMNNLAEVYQDEGKYSQSEALLSRLQEIQRRVLGPEHPDTLISMDNLAGIYEKEGKYPQADLLLSQILEIQRRVLGPEHPDTLIAMNSLAIVYEKEGKYMQSETLSGRTLEIERRVLGSEHSETLRAMNSLAIAYMREGKHIQAERVFSQLLEIDRHVLGLEHPDTLTTMNNLSITYENEGKYIQAERLNKEVLEAQIRVRGPEHPDALNAMANLAILYRSEGKWSLAEQLSIKALEVNRRVLGPEHPQTLVNMMTLAALYKDEGKYSQAESSYTDLLAIERRVLGPENPTTLNTVNGLAVTFQNEGKYIEAEQLFTKTLDVCKSVFGLQHRNTLVIMNNLASIYVQLGKYVQAEVLLREERGIHQNQKKDTWDRHRCDSLLGASLAGQKKYAEAEPLLLAGYEGMQRQVATTPYSRRPDLKKGIEATIHLYQSWGKPQKAAEWQRILASNPTPAAQTPRSK